MVSDLVESLFSSVELAFFNNVQPLCERMGEEVGLIIPVSWTEFGERILNVQVPDCPRKPGTTLRVEGRLPNETDLDVVSVTGLPLIDEDVETGTVTVGFVCICVVGLEDVTMAALPP